MASTSSAPRCYAACSIPRGLPFAVFGFGCKAEQEAPEPLRPKLKKVAGTKQESMKLKPCT